MQDELILIDAYSQIFRAYYAIRRLSNSRGEPTNAVFVFTRLLLGLDQHYPSARGAMLFDCGKVNFRLKLNPEYKANRPPMPEELKCQVPVIRELAAAFGWPLLEEREYEADDLIAAFAGAYSGQVRIVSSDKDLAQLVDERVRILAPAAKGGFEERGRDEIIGKFNVPPEYLVDYLALLGDASDNIPGVPGIGSKGAAELLRTCGPAERWLDHPEVLSGTKFEKKLLPALDIMRRNRDLIRLRTDLPERFRKLDQVLVRTTPDWAAIRGVCERMELRSILKELPAFPSPEEEGDDLFTPREPSPAEHVSGEEMIQGELF